MNKKARQQLDFDFELRFCLEKPIVFLNEAKSLRYISQVLYEFEKIKMTSEKSDELNMFSEKLVNVGYFPYRTIRMLMAYSLENITKYIIICNYKEDNPESLIVPLDKIDSHLLEILLSSVGYKFPKKYRLYISSWTKCSIWAGRYPLPLSRKYMFESRNTSKDKELIRVALGSNKGQVESDILHSGITDIEYQAYIEIFEDLRKYI